MTKRTVLAVIAVFVAWQILDFLIHNVWLMSTYEATAELWRPMEEMKMPLMMLVGLVTAVVFVCLYAWLIRPKSVFAGLSFGILFGIATGFSMGFGTYCVMPIPQKLAVAWSVGSLVETVLAGLLVGWIVKEPEAASRQ
jgi:hypothetical protein